MYRFQIFFNLDAIRGLLLWLKISSVQSKDKYFSESDAPKQDDRRIEGTMRLNPTCHIQHGLINPDFYLHFYL